MKDLFKQIRRFLCYLKHRCLIKSAKPSAELEDKILEARVQLFGQVNLLRLSHAELIKTSKELRFSVMQELINDIARSKK